MVTDVLVVGAGPAGLVLAWLLQAAGVRVIVVEALLREEIGADPKAGIVEYRTAQLTAEGLVGPVLSFDAENHRCEFRSADDATVVDYAALTGGRPHYVLPQHELVARMVAALDERGSPALPHAGSPASSRTPTACG